MRSLIIALIGKSLNFLSYFLASRAATLALKLFSKPKKGRLTDEQIPVIQSAYYEDLEFENYSVATYRWIGDNKVVLLVHGWESNTTRWHQLVKLLKEQNHTIISLDAPAHGQSSSDEFNAILYSQFINCVVQKYKPEIIVGHSVGGMATIFGLNTYDFNCVKKIALLGAPAHYKGVFERYVSMMGYNKRITEAMSLQVQERHGHHPDYFSITNFAQKIDQQTLVIHDKHDTVIPYEEAVLIKSAIKNSKMFSTENKGHSLQCLEVNSTILHFINS